MTLLTAFGDSSNLVILVGTLSIVIPAPFILAISLTIKFTQKENDKMISLKGLIILFTLQVLSLIALTLSWIFLFIPIGDGTNNQALFIVFLVFTFILAASWYSMILFFSQYIWVSFEENKITTFADTIKIAKIEKIIKDTNSKFIYINWTEGSRTIKRLKISRESVLGQFVLENIEKHTGKKVSEESQVQYYRDQLLKSKSVTVAARNSAKTKQEDKKNIEEPKDSEK